MRICAVSFLTVVTGFVTIDNNFARAPAVPMSIEPPPSNGPLYMLTVHVSFPDEANRDEWLVQVDKLARSAKEDEPGCLTFSVSHDQSDPLKLLLLERYVDKAAFETHKQTDAFKAFVKALSSIERQVSASYLTESTTVGFSAR